LVTTGQIVRTIFFPKSYPKQKGYSDNRINHILNVTIVDDFLNKREIRAKAPSDYMEKFRRTNSDLKMTMKTHLIENIDTFGIWDDNYDLFIQKRAEVVSNEISKRIIQQEIDN